MHWLVNHRINSALPGYLMIGAKGIVSDFDDLAQDALYELGPLLALFSGLLKSELGAERVYAGRYGHAPHHNLHFHLIPIYPFVEDLFWKDPRYRLLEQFAHGPGESAADGAELTLFVWREFCERPDPPAIEGPSVAQAIERLRMAAARP